MMVVDALVVLLVVVGLAGSVIPFLPGTPLILAGAVLHAAASGFDPIGPGRLAVLTVLALGAYGLDYAAGVLGARRFGGTGWAVAGALAGLVVGAIARVGVAVLMADLVLWWARRG